MRGEQNADGTDYWPGGGSPPLARGTGRSNYFLWPQGGITPACAGNRLHWRSVAARKWDHPRLRGEQNGYTYNAGNSPGSPPLARGTANPAAPLSSRGRITPACAGNRYHPFTAEQKEKDHPRLRGEQYSLPQVPHLRMGSPPLARGTDPLAPHRPRKCGITPACAGNSNTTGNRTA